MTNSPYYLGKHCQACDLSAQLRPGQWCVFGVPISFDFEDATRGGMGPLLIRKSLPFLWDGFPRLLWDWTSDSLVETMTNLPLDLGDIPYDRRTDRAYEVEDRIVRWAADIAGNGGRPLVLGGEHWITFPVLQGLTKHVGPVSVVHFDAHTDTHRWIAPRGAEPRLRNNNVMTFVESLDGVERLLQIGVREYDVAIDLETAGASAKCAVIPPDAINDAIFDGLPEGSKVYVTIDADVLDPAFAPEVGWPVPGGITVRQLLAMIRQIRRRYDVVGLDLVEVMGIGDGVNRAALAMARCALAFLADDVTSGGPANA
ncbi:arginase family protein [Streptosporangiaceae bacterium NEAU-GS5]|nr:arginase family protein [Streptosporangiaceae bacterium NEAU-GS5]